VSVLEHAQEGDIVFVEKEKRLPEALHSPATAVIVPRNLHHLDKPGILTDHPRHAFARILQLLSEATPARQGIDPTVRMGTNVTLGQDVSIGAYTIVGSNVKLGNRARIGPSCFIGDDASVGDDCVLHARVTLQHEVTLGNRVKIHSGCVIGADGFGYFPVNGEHQKMPQIGTVILEDDVELGANTTVDRGTFGPTRIGRGTKIDNLVQIAHNVRIGEHCILCAQTGISGSTTIGNGVVIGGQAGIGDHITIGDGTVIAARGGVISDLPPHSFVSGYPAGPHRDKMKVEAAIRRVPELLKTVRALSRTVASLSAERERNPRA
jgi:UDP-3-O-[3-hydroxymyristoyl] glucosamine N-acyltransferase